MLRAKSTLFTGGLGNLVIATAELGGALLVSLLALAAPFSRSRWSSCSCGWRYDCSGGCFEPRIRRRLSMGADVRLLYPDARSLRARSRRRR